MKIGLVIYGSLETISGGFLYDRKLVEYLRGQGDQVEIVSLPWRSYPRHLSDNLSRQLYRQLKNLDIDFLLQDELNHPSLIWANLKLRQQERRIPLVTIVHHLRCNEQRPAWKNYIYTQIERDYLETLDAFIFNSQHTFNSVASVLKPGRGLLSKPTIIARPAGDRFNQAISPEEITTRQREPGPLRLVFLGNLITRKGLHILLDALAGLSKSDWEMVVIGSSESEPAYAQRVRRQSASLGLTGQVHFAGTLADDRLAAALRQSQLLVLPSSHEGYGIAYLEGMSFGLPAIAGSSGAAGELVTDRENGLLVPPGDAATLRDAIASLINGRELLLEFSLAARRRFEEHPTWEQTASQIRSFLLSLGRFPARPEPTQ